MTLFDEPLPEGWEFVAVLVRTGNVGTGDEWPRWQGEYEVRIREPKHGMTLSARGKTVEDAMAEFRREWARP